MRFSFRSTVALAVFLVLIGLGISGLLLVQRLDGIVNRDLYDFGLQFSQTWADTYQVNLGLLIGCVVSALVVVGISGAVFVGLGKNHIRLSRFVCFGLLVGSMFLFLASEFFFIQLDNVVNTDLYGFGLVFDSIWALVYWTFSRVFMAIVGVAAVVALGFGLLLLFGAQSEDPVFKLTLAKGVSSVLTAVGSLLIVTAVVYESSTLALVGLGVLFWGLVFIYVKTERYAKKSVLSAIASSQLVTLNHILEQAELKGNAVYLPSKYSSDGLGSRVFIAEHSGGVLPTPEQTRSETSLMIENPSGLLLVPTGAELAGLFERTLKTNFEGLELEALEPSLSKVIVDELEMAKRVEVLVKAEKIRVKIGNSVSVAPNGVFSKSGFSAFGSPLGSAIACVICKATGKPVMVEKEQNIEGGKSLVVDYRVL